MVVLKFSVMAIVSHPPMPHVFVINLKRRTDRLMAVRKCILTPFEVVEAVDARTLTWDSVSSFVTIRALKKSQRAESMRVPTVDHREQTLSDHLTLGAVACAMSHRKTWHLVVERALPYAVICEDDLDGAAMGFSDRMRAALDTLPANWTLAYIGYHDGRCVVDTMRRFAFRAIGKTELLTGLFGYAVSSLGAKTLLDKTRRLHTQLDVQVASMGIPAVYCPVQCQTLVTAPESGDSDVQTYAGQCDYRAHSTLDGDWTFY